jgi:hypothetical protein
MNLFTVQRLRSIDFQFLVEALKSMEHLSSVSFEVLDDRSLVTQLRDNEGDGPYLPKSVFWLVRRFLLSLPNAVVRDITIYVGPLTPTQPYNFPQEYFSWDRFSELADAYMVFRNDRTPFPLPMNLDNFRREVEHVISGGINAAIPGIPRCRLHRSHH